MADQEKSKLAAKKFEKSYFDVLGICCSSEVPIVEKILKSLDGVKDFSVIVPTRTVIVVHDNLLVSQIQIVKALNQARLEANVRVKGDTNYQKKWPSPFALASGVLLLLSLFKFVYHPLRWLALGAVALGILPIFLKGVASLRNFRLDINILVLIAVGGTIAMKDYVEAGTIVFLFTIAQWLESRASHQANAVMSSLMSMAPQKAVIAETGEEVDVDEVKLNTILAVKSGDVIPIDGVVVEGNCEVDEKALTGESFPVPKQVDSSVWAGTINLNGYVSVKTTALVEDCVVAKMAKLVEEAQNSKSKTQRLIDRIARYYTPAVVIISAGLVALPLVIRLHNHNQWFHLALVVLVSACPCALILSTPVATFCALSEAAASGLLIKGGEYLETLAKIKAIAFDKTGTITRGEFVVTDFQSLRDDISLDSLLYWVSSIESKSSHPMAAALVDHGRSLSVEPKPESVEDFQNFPGEGIHGRIDGRDIYIGNKRIALRAGSETVPTIEGKTTGGRTTGYIYCGATPAGIFCLSDACRTGVIEAIRGLKLLGIKTAMLTGDSSAAAMYAQEQLDHALGAVHAELLPEDKVRIVKELKKEGPTAMIGDGVNDAPALATADIGISMGISGSALAMETGHVILMSNDLRKIPKAIQLAQKAHRKVIENVIISMSSKVAILALAFAGHPLVWAAVLADVGTCLLVIFNSMLLLRGTHKHGGKCCKSSAAAHNHKLGNEKSSLNHKNCCSRQEVERVCKPKKSCCGSGCQSSHVNVISCRKRARVNESTCNGVQEPKPCGHVSCNPVYTDIEANVPHNHGHSASGNVTCCSAHTHKCTTTAETHGTSTGQDLQEAESGHNSQCHHGNHHGAPCHSKDNNTHLEEAQKKTKDGNFDACRHHDEGHADIHSNEESAGRCIEIHPETEKCSKDLSNTLSATTHGHACVSLGKRESGSCCKSYIKECCSKHAHLTTELGGILSEVIIEKV